MTSKNDFEERLKRIQQSRGIVPGPLADTGGASNWALPGKPRRKGGLTIGFVVGGMLSLGMMGFAALYFIASLGLSVPYAAGQDAVASLSADASATGPQTSKAGWLERLFGTGLARNTSGDPIAYLPEAPSGWVRVTTADAQQPDALAVIAARWPADGGPFDSHPGQGDLEEFVRIYDGPDTEQRVLSETRTRALYLGPEGQLLSLRLHFRPERDALGVADDPSSWTDAVLAEVTTAAQVGDTVETFELGSLTVFNRAPQGKAGAAQRTAPAPLDLTVALHPRAVVEIRGMAQPAAAIALIESVDRAALITRLAQD